MKDYRLIVDTIDTAEAMLKDYTKQAEQEIKTKGSDVFEQVAEYLWQVLRNANFPRIDLYENRHWGVQGDGLPFGSMQLNSYSCNNYKVMGKYYNAQLFICCGGENVTKIYFNENEYFIEGQNNKDTLIYLCYKWKALKRQIEPAVIKYFEKRNKQVKAKVDEINMKKHLVDSFEI